jgi:CheY-like chemotaxis protein/cellobiose-specific phosphotransferase system component IIA
MTDQMKEIVSWLRGVEEFAHELYSSASAFFAGDLDLSRFLERLALDEAAHYHLMGSALEYISDGRRFASSIELDPITMAHAENPLEKANNLLLRGTLTQTQMIKSIVTAENSEWNVLFLYAIDSLKSLNKMFEYGASVIQSHQARIEHFLATHPQGSPFVDGIRQLPTVWKPRFLVVEDEEPLRSLLRDLLAPRARVETSPDGKDALSKIRRHFFDVIVSDINMPKMNGVDLFGEATKEDPELRRRFVFCSGAVTAHQQMFFRENSLPHLNKPFSINHLIDVIDHVLRESAEALDIVGQAIGTRTSD